jgi:pimeloyl-ACP methyl ester carboxylesterase
MMERDAVLDQLGEINVPALLIHGEDNKMYPL